VIGRDVAIFREMSAAGPVFCKIPCGPSGSAATVVVMLIAGLICSDEDCAAEAELLVLDLDDLDAAACACGCTLVLLSLSAWTRAEARVPALAAA
jgi:hypothetical protein